MLALSSPLRMIRNSSLRRNAARRQLNECVLHVFGDSAQQHRIRMHSAPASSSCPKRCNSPHLLTLHAVNQPQAEHKVEEYAVEGLMLCIRSMFAFAEVNTDRNQIHATSSHYTRGHVHKSVRQLDALSNGTSCTRCFVSRRRVSAQTERERSGLEELSS